MTEQAWSMASRYEPAEASKLIKKWVLFLASVTLQVLHVPPFKKTTMASLLFHIKKKRLCSICHVPSCDWWFPSSCIKQVIVFS